MQTGIDLNDLIHTADTDLLINELEYRGCRVISDLSDPSELLSELDANAIIDELEQRGYYVISDLSDLDTDELLSALNKQGFSAVKRSFIEKLYYAYEHNDEAQVRACLKNLFYDTIGRII